MTKKELAQALINGKVFVSEAGLIAHFDENEINPFRFNGKHHEWCLEF